jgi:hypothetical protein
MLRFFLTRYAFKQRPISEAALQEAKQALKEIKRLGASTKYDYLVSALVLVDEAEMKYPFFQATAFYCRGEVGMAMSKTLNLFVNIISTINPSPKP